jgi:hypothetical protein
VAGGLVDHRQRRAGCPRPCLPRQQAAPRRDYFRRRLARAREPSPGPVFRNDP